MMSAYLVTYTGLWLGGKAIVIAKSKAEALQLVQNHSETVSFESDSTVELLPLVGVIYNDNGDY
jgi:hypothetical protein